VRWRTEAKILHQRRCAEQASLLEGCAAELESAMAAAGNEALTLSQASEASGYSADHLGRMLREGRLPNAGQKGQPRIRRADLPRRIAPTQEAGYDPHADARTLLAG